MQVPNHVALIVDGNRRWAKAQPTPFFAAYKQAGINLVNIVAAAAEEGVSTVTAFLFSTENWKRDQSEVDAVMKAFGEILYEHNCTFKRKGVRVHAIGDIGALPDFIQDAIAYATFATQDCTSINFVLAFNYGGRWDMLEALKTLLCEFGGNSDELTEDDIAMFLSTSAFGDPDLLIRTGGQQRISNFMMWQLAYTELFFSELMWPDFDAHAFKLAVEDYQCRKRTKGS